MVNVQQSDQKRQTLGGFTALAAVDNGGGLVLTTAVAAGWGALLALSITSEHPAQYTALLFASVYVLGRIAVGV